MTTIQTSTTCGKKSVTIESAQILEQARLKLKALAGQQQELAENKEEALIARESLDRKGNQVRLQRDRTANAEVAFMNALRDHYNNIGASFPANIDAAYSAVDTERNQLGLLEAEHSELEEELGAQEWTLVDQENALYQYDLQQLLINESDDDERDDPPATRLPSKEYSESIYPSAGVQYQLAMMQRSRLMERFMAMRRLVADIIDATTLTVNEAGLLDLGTLEFATSFSDLLSQIAACEVRLQHLQIGRDNGYGTSLNQGYATSEPLPVPRKLVTSFDTLSRACSASALPDPVDQIPGLHRIREWLLDCLKQNAVEKAQYLSILQHTLGHLDHVGSDFPEWEMLVTEAWSRDSEANPTEAEKPLTVVPFSDQGTIQDVVSLSGTMKDDDLETGSGGLSPGPQRSHHESGELLLGDLCIPSIAIEPSPSALHGSNEILGPLLTVPDVQMSSWEDASEQHQFPGDSNHKRDVTNPLINLATVPESDTRRDSVQDCLPRRSDIVELPTHTPCTQESPETSLLWTTEHFSDFLTQGDTTILPMPNIIYSPTEWSVGLQHFYVLGLVADDNVAEVFWSRDDFISVHDVEVMGSEMQTGWDKRKSDDGSNIDLLCSHPTRRRWLDSRNHHVGQLDSRYCRISDLEQPRFFIAGRVSSIVAKSRINGLKFRQVFSTMRLVTSEKDGPLSNLMALRKRSESLAHYERHWLQFCFVVVQNNGNFSQCLSIQPSCGCQDHQPYLTDDWGIVHTSEDPPPPYPWEKLSEAPLRVHPVNEENLPAFARIYYTKVFSVEHKFPILEVGSVAMQDLHRFSFRYTLSLSSERVSRLDGMSCNISEIT